jgi:invasion protein IalB
MYRPVAAAVALALLSAPALFSPAAAQQRGAAPPAQQQTFGSWQRGCERAGRTQVCSLRQLVAPKEHPTQPILAIAIGRLTPDRKMTMVMKLPTQMDRTRGVGLRIDDGEMITVPVQGCDAGACTAAMTLDDDVLKRLRDGNQALVAFRVPPSGEAVALPVSLQGLTRGLASLK